MNVIAVTRVALVTASEIALVLIAGMVDILRAGDPPVRTLRRVERDLFGRHPGVIVDELEGLT